METLPRQPRVVKFGVFEADLEAGELRKSGVRQKLVGPPFQVLQVLLEHPKEVVTREQLPAGLPVTQSFRNSVRCQLFRMLGIVI